MTAPRTARLLLPLILLLLAPLACDREEPIRVYTAPPNALPAAEPLWQLPDGWQDFPGSGMRHSTLVIPQQEGTPLQASVTSLTGQAGGTLANVNRWRNQIGLEPMTQEEIDQLATVLPRAGGQALFLEIVNKTTESEEPPQRILGAIIPRPDRTWFVKLMGADQPVAEQRDDFLTFVKSIRFTDERPATDRNTNKPDDAP